MNPSNRFEENISLVGFVFQKHFKNQTYDIDDIMQEGYVALWKACCLFDETKGFKFSTFACRYIRGFMLNYLKKQRNNQNRIVPLETVIFENGKGGEIFLNDTLSVEPDCIDLENIVDFCIKKMNKKEQKIITYLLNGNTQNETAKKNLTSQSSVRRCLSKFRNLVKEELKK